jgi:hypothetical protein
VHHTHDAGENPKVVRLRVIRFVRVPINQFIYLLGQEMKKRYPAGYIRQICSTERYEMLGNQNRCDQKRDTLSLARGALVGNLTGQCKLRSATYDSPDRSSV